MPAKKRSTKKAPAKKKPRAKPTNLRQAEAQRASEAAAAQLAEVERLSADLLAVVPFVGTPLPDISLSDAIAARDWRALIGPDAEARVIRLAEALQGRGGPDDSSSWNALLEYAGIPWLAWSIMRDDMPLAQELFKVWQRRRAAQMAEEVLAVSDLPVYTPEDAAALRIKIGARRWVAERLDPVVFGAKEQRHSIIDKREQRTYRVEIVDESAKNAPRLPGGKAAP